MMALKPERVILLSPHNSHKEHLIGALDDDYLKVDRFKRSILRY